MVYVTAPVDESSIDVAVKLIDTVLDTVFPAESAANEFIGQLLANTDTEIRARGTCLLSAHITLCCYSDICWSGFGQGIPRTMTIQIKD